jgi:(R,R)-butanediol dehydrogenase/meso-butanediol dehydrogenase/diacetyl reductase
MEPGGALLGKETDMRAVRLHGTHDLRVDTIPEPDSVGDNEIRVRPLWAGVCGSDLHEYETGGYFIPKQNMPQILGHEFSASVLEIGRDVRNVVVGQRVSVVPHIYCGSCAYCRGGRRALCRNIAFTGMSWPWGGLAEQAVVPAYQAIPVPDAVTDEQAAILEPLASAEYAVRRAGVGLGSRVLITGAGPIGQLAILVALASGAEAVFVSEPNAIRRAQAAALGATVLDPKSEEVVATVIDACDGIGVDASIECSGVERGLTACCEATRAGGTIAQVAIHVGARSVAADLWTLKDLNIRGSWSWDAQDMPRLLRLIASGKLPVERIVTQRISIEDIAAGLASLGDPSGDQIKVLARAW